MELKKWIAVGVIGLEAAAALVVGGAGPTTAPATQPLARTALQPSTARAAADNSFNNNFNNRQNRGNRRGRGNNRNSSSGVLVDDSSDAYAILKARSIFVKGNQTIASDVRPSVSQFQPGAFVGRSEAQLVFNGVIIVNGEADALIEDLSTNNVMTVRPGVPISGGRVSAITFDDLAYEVGGRTLHVEIGQTLQGSSPSFNSAPTTSPTTAPAFPAIPGPTIAPPGTTGDISASDLEARMKARRAQQEGGGN